MSQTGETAVSDDNPVPDDPDLRAAFDDALLHETACDAPDLGYLEGSPDLRLATRFFFFAKIRNSEGFMKKYILTFDAGTTGNGGGSFLAGVVRG